jgi:adenylate cyclase
LPNPLDANDVPVSPTSQEGMPSTVGRQAAVISPPIRRLLQPEAYDRRDSVFRLFRPISREGSPQQPTFQPFAAPKNVSPFLYQTPDQPSYNSALDSPSLELPNPFTAQALFHQEQIARQQAALSPQQAAAPVVPARPAESPQKERRKESKGFFNTLLNKRKNKSQMKPERATRQESETPAAIAEPQFSSPFAAEAEPRSKRSSLRLPPMRRSTAERMSMSGRNSGVSPSTSSRTSQVAPIAPKEPNELVLDTDLSQLNGIVDVGKIPTLKPIREFSFSKHAEVAPFQEVPEEEEEAAWAPPESWAVRRPEDIARDDGLLEEYDPLDDTVPSAPTENVLGTQIAKSASKRAVHHQMRLYRGDWTFATVSCPLNTTTEALMSIVGRKFFLSSVANHQVLIQRNGLSRILQAWEKPFVLQKQLLEQAGYTPEDRIEEIGREDNSYLCRFIFKTISAPSFSVVSAKSSLPH